MVYTHVLLYLHCSLISDSGRQRGRHLILLDEPFNALDESGIKEIRDLLRELRQKGKLIVLTCHDRQQMESLADEIIAMREGRIVNVDKNCHEEV